MPVKGARQLVLARQGCPSRVCINSGRSVRVSIRGAHQLRIVRQRGASTQGGPSGLAIRGAHQLRIVRQRGASIHGGPSRVAIRGVHQLMVGGQEGASISARSVMCVHQLRVVC